VAVAAQRPSAGHGIGHAFALQPPSELAERAKDRAVFLEMQTRLPQRLHRRGLQRCFVCNDHRYVSYTIRPCFCDREMRSVAYSPLSTNSTHDARVAGSDELFTSNAFSHARGTRLSRSA